MTRPFFTRRLYGNSPGAVLFALPCLGAVFFAFLLPYGASFKEAFNGEITVWRNSAILHITLFTIKQAFFSVLVALAIGLPGAWFLGSGKNRPLLRTLSAIPFAMPSILVVLGFVLFYGNSGWINRIISSITGGEGPLKILYKPAAIILAHGFFNFPLVIRLAGDGLAGIRKNYSAAAENLGSSPFMTMLWIILPLSIPSILSAVLLVFLYSFTSFAVVLVLGGGPASTTLPVEIYRHARIFLNYHNAGALAIIETLIAVTVFLSYAFFSKKSAGIKTGMDDPGFEKITSSKRLSAGRIIITLYGIATALFILGPLVSIVLESFLWRPSRSAGQIPGLIWWRSLGETCFPAFLRSISLAVFSATLASVIASLAAFSLLLPEIKGEPGNKFSLIKGIIRFFAAAPIISSGIVLGLGWLIVYGRNDYFAPVTLVILHSVIALPFAFNSISEGFRSLPDNLFKASALLGANPLRVLITIALPLSLKRIRSAWGFAAALSLGELNAIMMLGLEKWETLPLYIYRATGAYRYGNACAAGTLLILCCAGCFLLSEGVRGFNELRRGRVLQKNCRKFISQRRKDRKGTRREENADCADSRGLARRKKVRGGR